MPIKDPKQNRDYQREWARRKKLGLETKNIKYIERDSKPNSVSVSKKRTYMYNPNKDRPAGNHKSVGEQGERITIGELAKFNIDVAIPLSDNYPYDMIAIYNNKLYKIQVKSSNIVSNTGALVFTLKKNNWYNKTSKKYTSEEIDIFVLCDFNTIYLLKPEEFNNRSGFTIRLKKTMNSNSIQRLASDYQISEKRIKDVFI
jgi:hypothetical protein